MHVPTQIIVFYYNVFCGSRRKSWVRPGRRRNEDNSPRLRLVRLIIEASVAGNLYVGGAIENVNPRPTLRLILLSDVATRV